MEIDFAQIILNALFFLCTVAVGWLGWRLVKFLETLEEKAASSVGTQVYNLFVSYVETMVHAAWDKLGEATGGDRLAWVVEQSKNYINALEPGLNQFLPFPVDFKDEDIEQFVRGVYDKIVKELKTFEPGVDPE